jgi:hypothetical protein
MTHHDLEQPIADDAQPTQSIGYLPSQAEEPPPPPLRPRRRKLPIATLALSLAAAAGVGFFAGVRVEKANVTPSGSSSTRNGANLAALGFGNAANTGSRAGAAPSAAAASGNPGGGTAGRTNAGGVGGTANIVGTITVVQGGTLYITEASGDTVKVTTSDGTTVTKTTTGAVKDLAPGESVVIRGVQSADGVYAAQSVTQGSAAAGGFGGFGGGRTGAGRGARTGGAASTPTTGTGN